MSGHILVREHGEDVPILLKAILRIEGDNEYVTVILKNGKRFTRQVGSIGVWDRKNISCMVKIWRSHIVNYHRVVSFSLSKGVMLSLCSIKEYEKMLALKDENEREEAIRKNTLRLPLNVAGKVALDICYEKENNANPPGLPEAA